MLSLKNQNIFVQYILFCKKRKLITLKAYIQAFRMIELEDTK
jgi:hypothetical protein